MSDVISNASFVNKDSTKKLTSYQPLVGARKTITIKRNGVLYTAIPNH